MNIYLLSKDVVRLWRLDAAPAEMISTILRAVDTSHKYSSDAERAN